MNHEYNSPLHPFTVGDYVKAKYGMAKGLGKVTRIDGSSFVYVDWLEEEGNPPSHSEWHYGNLVLTQERPGTAKDSVLQQLRAERNRLTEERTAYLSESNNKLSQLDIAIRAVSNIEL